MSSRQNGFGHLGIILLLLAVGVIIFLSYYIIQRRIDLATPGSPVRGMHVKLENTRAQYTKDRYVEVRLTVTNKTGEEQYFAWGNCAEMLNHYVDGEQKNKSQSGSCLIGYPPLRNDQTVSRIVQYDPSNLSAGRHTLLLTINNIPSNEIDITISSDIKQIANCYEHTEYPTPLCANLTIHTNSYTGDADQNNRHCNTIKQAMIDGTPLRPIPSLSTTGCDQGENAKFVMNIPPEDRDSWQQKIKALRVNAGFSGETTLYIEKL